MEERGIFKDKEATPSLNVVQNSMPLIGPAEELLMPSPARAPAATPDSKKRDRAGQYESGSQAMLSSLHILSGTPFTKDFPASKRDKPEQCESGNKAVLLSMPILSGTPLTEESGIFKDNEAPQSLGVVQNSVPLIGPTEELLMPSPASAAAATPDSKKRDGAGQYESGSQAMLSSMQILSGTPVTEDFPASKRGRGLYNFNDLGISSSHGSHLTHQILTVNSGEDISQKICFLAQQFRAISIISGHGTISSVTLRRSGSPDGTSKYEGIFELLSLDGLFLPSNAGINKTCGSVAVSLASPDGQAIGGQLAGPLVAAGPVQVVVACLQPEQQKPKKQRTDYSSPTAPPTSSHNNNDHVSAEQLKTDLGGMKPIMSPAGSNSASFSNGQGSDDSSSSSVDDEHV